MEFNAENGLTVITELTHGEHSQPLCPVWLDKIAEAVSKQEYPLHRYGTDLLKYDDEVIGKVAHIDVRGDVPMATIVLGSADDVDLFDSDDPEVNNIRVADIDGRFHFAYM